MLTLKLWVCLLVMAVVAWTAPAAAAENCPTEFTKLTEANLNCEVKNKTFNLAKDDVRLVLRDVKSQVTDQAGSFTLVATEVVGVYSGTTQTLIRAKIAVAANKATADFIFKSEEAKTCAPAMFQTGGVKCWLPQSLEVSGAKKGDESLAALDPQIWKDEKTQVKFDNVTVTLVGSNAGRTAVLLQLEKTTTAATTTTTTASAGGGTGEQPASSTPACSEEPFRLVDQAQLAKFQEECRQQDELCITPSGQVIHEPELVEGKKVGVVLYHPPVADLDFTVEAKFKKSIVMRLGDMLREGDQAGATDWRRGPSTLVSLTSAGTLEVTTKVDPHGKAVPVRTSTDITSLQRCVQSTTLERTKSFEVTGHYHFMFGIMPTYAGLYSRNYTLHRSDDGVQRVYAQDVEKIDLSLTLSGYPFGVSADEFAAVGLLLATSVTDLGKRWYAGVELSTPIGLGVAAGAAFIIVPELDDDFVNGQPLEGSQVPTHDTVVPTWFVGVNVQAELFRLAFKGLVDDDDE